MKVNLLLSLLHFDSRETWMLLHAWTLCILRCDQDGHGELKEQGQAWKRRKKKTEKEKEKKLAREGTAGQTVEAQSAWYYRPYKRYYRSKRYYRPYKRYYHLAQVPAERFGREPVYSYLFAPRLYILPHLLI
jgi:hypothetical protein